MQTWAILAAKHGVLISGIGLGAVSAPVWGSLEGIAVGLLLAGIGLAAVSARPAPSCPIGPAGGQVAAAHGGPPARGRMSRFRRRVDGVLTGILSDDEDNLPLSQRNRAREGLSDAEEKRFETLVTWDGDYVDALPWHQSRPPDPYPAVLPRSPDPNLAGRASAGRSSGIAGLPESSVTPWPQTPARQGPEALGDSPWLTVSAAFDGEQLWPLGNRRPGQARNRNAVDRPGHTVGDLEQFMTLPPAQPLHRDDFQWFAASPAGASDRPAEASPDSSDDERDARRWSAGPGSDAGEGGGGSAGAAGEAGGYRSKHRMDGPAGDVKPPDSRRSRARHAAPAPGASSALGRKAGGPKPPSRSAPHGPSLGVAPKYPGAHK
jgi:hypothetical protein